jgi:integrase
LSLPDRRFCRTRRYGVARRLISPCRHGADTGQQSGRQKAASSMRTKLTQTVAQGFEPRTRAYVVYDAGVPGFGVRITAAGARAWTYEYRPGGGRGSATRRMTLGRIEAMPYAKARKAAEALYHRTRLGEDPAGARDDQRGAITVADLLGRYMREELPALKPRTAALYAGYAKNHVVPALGRKSARDVTFSDIAKLHRAIGAAGAKVAANRVTSFISAVYAWASRAGEVPRGTNPTRDVTRFREQARTRYLSDDEIARLGETLALAETTGLPYAESDSKHASGPEQRHKISPYATGAIRLLLLTGCRLSEILNLRWIDVDFERALLMLRDSKTGARVVWLNAAALAVLEELSKIQIGDYVVAGDRPDAPRSDLAKPWRQVTKHADLKDVTLHTLRHTNASVGVGAGIGLPLVGSLLGHRNSKTTARYAHVAAEPVRRAAETIGSTIAAALERRSPDNVVEIRGGKR